MTLPHPVGGKVEVHHVDADAVEEAVRYLKAAAAAQVPPAGAGG